MVGETLTRRFKASVASGARKVPKGELWLGTDLLLQSGLEDTLDGHLRLCERLGHSVLCLSIADAPKLGPGYRYFGEDVLRDAKAASDMPVVAVVDGPFQAIVDKLGLMKVLVDWRQNPDGILDAYSAESERALELITRIAEHSVSGVVIADDLSTESGPFINPADIAATFSGFYTKAIETINSAQAVAFLHSCGNLEKLIPAIKEWGVDGLAALQSGVNDIVALHGKLAPNFLVLGGIELGLLEMRTSTGMERLSKIIDALCPEGDLILGTSSGLYRHELLDGLAELYRFAEEQTKLA